MNWMVNNFTVLLYCNAGMLSRAPRLDNRNIDNHTSAYISISAPPDTPAALSQSTVNGLL